MEEQDSIEFIYQVVKEKVDLAFQNIEHIETKAGILIGFIIGFNGVIISLALNIIERAYLPLFIISIFSFLSALYLNFNSFKIKRYKRDPNPRALMDKYWNKSKEEITKQLISNLVGCYEYNETVIFPMGHRVNYSMILTFLGLVFLFASVLKN